MAFLISYFFCRFIILIFGLRIVQIFEFIIAIVAHLRILHFFVGFIDLSLSIPKRFEIAVVVSFFLFENVATTVIARFLVVIFCLFLNQFHLLVFSQLYVQMVKEIVMFKHWGYGYEIGIRFKRKTL